MRRLLTLALGAIAVVLAIAFVFRGAIALRLMERVIARNLATSLLDELPDGLHVGLCGAGSPLPDPERSGPCVAIIAGRTLYTVDAGSGASKTLGQMRLPQGRVEGVFLTHFHSDHIDGLGELMLQRWVNGANDTPMPVYGPPGVEQVVDGFNRAYAQDSAYRVAHHGEEVVPPSGAGGVARPFTAPTPGDGLVVLETDGLRVTAFRVDHDPIEPAVGYRFDYAGRSAVVSGDTEKSDNLARFARGVDLLVYEALEPELVALIERGAKTSGRANLQQIMADIVDYHTSPLEVAEIARDADVRYLLYYHIVPPLVLAPLERIFLEGVDEVYDGPVGLGSDGSLVSLPAGSDAIEARDLL